MFCIGLSNIASNILKFTKCFDNIEKIIRIIARFNYFFIFERIINWPRNNLFDDCYVIVRLSQFLDFV